MNKNIILGVFVALFLFGVIMFVLSIKGEQDDRDLDKWDTCVTMINHMGIDPNNTKERSELLKTCFEE